MAPDERRQAIVSAVLPLLRQQGRAMTTRQIAEVAGIAEGTIFRVFDSKEQLIDEALAEAFDPGVLFHAIDRIDASLPLRERLVAMVTLLQERFVEIFELMNAVGLVAPPPHLRNSEAAAEFRDRSVAKLLRLVEPDKDLLRVEPGFLLHVLRLLTFSASHHEISDHHMLTPDQIVDVVLDGTLIDPKD
jgi:AcrR family transcriptional regulator